jgi:PAS domain S-box-containing protein
MTLFRLNPVRIAALWVVIALAGAVTGWFGYRDREADMLARLVEDARRSAVAFDPADLARLAAARDDLPTPLYARIKARLQQLAAIDPAVRFVYIFRADPATPGAVVFLADSAQRGAKDESLPGDVYAEAAASPGLQTILRTGLPATEGPLGDEFGTWITGYAAIGAPDAPGAGPRHVLGLDIEAESWSTELWRAGFEHAFYVWIMLGLPLVALLVARRQGEQREVIRNLSEAMEQSQSAIMIVDLESRIEYANRGLCQQIGYTRRELLGRRWQDFQVQQTPPETIAELVTTVRAGRTWAGEWFNKRKSGEIYPVRGSITPVKRRDGSIACFVASVDDITEQRRRETELREARDLAQAGDRAKGQFLATMSHEVRTPLNGIVGFSSLLLETPLTPEQRDYVQTIRMSTEALIQLTGDILDFARIESGKLKLDPLACDPRECIEDALDLLAAKAAEKKIELLHRVAADVPAAVLTDGGRLRQVLVNLAGNAVKFTEKGEVLVSVRRLLDPAPAPGPGTEEMCVLEFAVQDTGIGIAPEHQGKLFRAFTQVDESTTRRFGGTGLGLAICRNLVELMGGTIGVASRAGAGATFTFTIRAPVAARAGPPPALPGLHLGLAVASPALRRELGDLVRSWQATVTECERPEELVGGLWEIALVEVGEDPARATADRSPAAGLPPEKTVALVPVSLPNETRTALRSHFRLLVNRPVHHAALFALLAGAKPAAVAAAPAPRFGFRVLVAEDNPVNQRLIQRVLGNLGCTAVIVPNGRLVLAELRERADRHDLVLLDLHMPEMDGLAALREIRGGAAGPRAQTMWIVALTADAREQQRTEALADGLNDYLTKPLNVGELERALRRFRQDRLERKT